MYLSFDEVVDDMLLYRMSEDEKAKIRAMSQAKLKDVYLQSGHDLRVFYRLWDSNNPFTIAGHYEPKIVDGVDINEKHPDNFSMRVIEAIWRRLQ